MPLEAAYPFLDGSGLDGLEKENRVRGAASVNLSSVRTKNNKFKNSMVVVLYSEIQPLK